MKKHIPPRKNGKNRHNINIKFLQQQSGKQNPYWFIKQNTPSKRGLR